MKKMMVWLLLLMLVGCGGETAEETPEQTPPAATATALPAATAVGGVEDGVATTADAPLFVSLIWHQHQPLYFKEPESGLYVKPWVRLHAAKDYVDMAAILERYPTIQATFNLTPSLLRQIQDLEAGARDLYWEHTRMPAEDLSDEARAFIASRFFDINPKIIARFPRYQALADDRASSGSWGADEYRDLQVLFNLGWTDPDFLAEGPMAALVQKAQGYSEADKVVVLEEHARLIAETIPVHRRLQDAGRIEITTTPFYHPILPLLYDSALAREAVPEIELPPRYQYPVDALAQVEQGVEFYERLFGRPPRGMWPAEGAVSEDILGIVGRAGIEWMASDEEVLARSLGQSGFARDGEEQVQEAAALYRPYVVQKRSRDPALYMIFRDKVISDRVGFTYSGMEGEAAARDFVDRLLAIRARLEAQGDGGPYLVSVILDGENAWEHYPNDGKAFLNEMYRLLEAEQVAGTLQTITPSAFLEANPTQPAIETLWAGSWISPDYLTWIGEEEENRAWEYLGEVRAFVQSRAGRLDEETLAAAMDLIYSAEGSDWFWWYGADQNSGDDGSFDQQFRETLKQVYTLLETPSPVFLDVPVIPQQAQPPEAGPTALVAPQIDGAVAAGEWDGAGYYVEQGGVQGGPEQILQQLWYGFSADGLFFRLDGRRPWGDVGTETRVGLYLTRPGATARSPFSRIGESATLLGFDAGALVEVVIRGDQATATLYGVSDSGSYEPLTDLAAAVAGTTIEVALPYADLGKPDAGDALTLRAVISEGEVRDIQSVPDAGPGGVVVPDLGLTTAILTVTDPTGDDHGPGSYVYPSDALFGPGAYDLTEFSVAEDENNLIFRTRFAGALNNEWGAPNGMGIHTVDLYIDVDGAPGARRLLPGRNAALPDGEGWDLAIWAEGWTPGLYAPPTDGPQPVEVGDGGMLTISADPTQNRITIRIRKSDLADLLGLDVLEPAEWGYLAVVMGQEGFPAGGVWRIRDVNRNAEQWRFGGAPAGSTTHPRIIDVAYPADGPVSQEEALGGFAPQSLTSAGIDGAGDDDFALLPMVRQGGR